MLLVHALENIKKHVGRCQLHAVVTDSHLDGIFLATGTGRSECVFLHLGVGVWHVSVSEHGGEV
jgi:hypothetical protein